MLEYVEQLCASEGVSVEPGVLPLVVRAGGGSPRDTLSLLDQLIAGSDPSEGSGQATVKYARAVALLGYTHAELLDEVVGAFAARDAGQAFAAVDRVVQTGQDPRRFVDDLLERLRDLIIVAATGDGAAAVLRGVPVDELERMGGQAAAFGTERLSRIADIVVAALDDMSGATSPRLQLELLVARVLASADVTVSSASSAPPASSAPVAVPGTAPTMPSAPAAPSASTAPVTAAAAPADPAVVDAPAPAPAEESPSPVPAGPVTFDRVTAAWPEILGRLENISRTSWMLATGARPVAYSDGDVLSLAFPNASDVAAFKKLAAGKGPSEDLRGAIQQVLGVRVKYVARHEPAASSDPPAASGPSAGPDSAEGSDASSARPDAGGPGAGDTPSPRSGGRPPAPAAQANASTPPAPASPAPPAPASSAPAPSGPVTEWAVAPIPGGDSPDASSQLAVDDEPEDAASVPVRTLTLEHDGDVLSDADAPLTAEEEEELPPPVAVDAPIPPRAPVAVERPAPARAPRSGGIERVGEAVVRQMLGATFVREEPYTPPTRFN